MNKPMKIAISGKSGCGNSTVSRLSAERLGLVMINYTFRSMAEERGIPFAELRRLAEEDSSWDLALDRRQIELAAGKGCVLGSRLAIWLLKDADLKVFLDAPVEVRACRIVKREGGDYSAVLEETIARDSGDRERYLRLYGIDNDDYGFADLVIDTSEMDPEQIADLIVRAARGSAGGPFLSKGCGSV